MKEPLLKPKGAALVGWQCGPPPITARGGLVLLPLLSQD